MLLEIRARSSIVAVALASCLAVPLAAQQQDVPTEFQSWQLPGWTFTPGMIFGTLYDSNVAVKYPDAVTGQTASDKLFQYQPFGQLEYFSPRTMFSSGYRGAIRRYFTLDELDGTDHDGYFSLRHLLSRRVTLFATENYMRVPTTDELQLNGVPFRRNGARYNAFAGGVEARLTRTIDFKTRYDLTWVDFVRKDTPTLTGGFVNGVRSSLSRRLTSRSSLGAEYGIRISDLNAGTKNLMFHEVGGVFEYRTGPLTNLEAAAGFAHLDDRVRNISRSGPYVRVGLTHRAERATLGLAFERSYVPSLSFGGTNQSQDVRGYLQMPLARNRFYVEESAAWRRTDPFETTLELPLTSIWIRTVGGYALQRWLRLEGYHQFTRQDTHFETGLISRHIVGVQVVVSQPMRIR